MLGRRRRWLTAAVAIVAVEAALILSAGVVLEASRQFHASIISLVLQAFEVLGALLPQGILAGLAAILGLLGAGWWQEHLIGPAFSGQSQAGLPALGAVLAAPVYTILRRSLGRRSVAAKDTHGAPPHRIYVAAQRKASQPEGTASAAIRESPQSIAA